MVDDKVYESAVKGRQDFRRAYREERAKCKRLGATNKALREALRECEEYFDQRADADQPSGLSPIPNEEMTLLVTVRAALADGET